MKTAAFICSIVLSLSLAGYSLANCGACKAGGSDKKCGSGGASCGDCAATVKAKSAEIQTPALKVLLASGVPVVVLDARTGKYDDGRRIPGAKLLAPDATADQAAALIPSKESLVVTYCSGLKCPASAALGSRLRALGFNNVLEYREGITGWTEDGNEGKKAM